MPLRLYTKEDAIELLKAAIGRAGGARKYAQKLGVSDSFVSQCVRGLKPLSGKILEDLFLERYEAYRFKVRPHSEEQERYENSRKEHRERYPNITKEEMNARREEAKNAQND